MGHAHRRAAAAGHGADRHGARADQRRLCAALASERAHRHVGRAQQRRLPGHDGAALPLRRRPGDRPGARRPAPHGADRRPGAGRGARGLHLRAGAGGRHPARREERAVRAAVAVEPAAGQGRLRPGDLHQRVRGPDRRCLHAHEEPEVPAGAAGITGRLQARALAGLLRQACAAVRDRGQLARLQRVRPRLRPAGPAVQAHRHPADQRSELRVDAGLREHEPPVQAQGAVRLPLPDVRLGADPGAAAAGSERRTAHARDLVDPPGRADAGLAPEGRPAIRRDGRSGHRLGPLRHAGQLDQDAADRGAACHGAGARACGCCRSSSPSRPWRSRSGRSRLRARR